MTDLVNFPHVCETNGRWNWIKWRKFWNNSGKIQEKSDDEFNSCEYFPVIRFPTEFVLVFFPHLHLFVYILLSEIDTGGEHSRICNYMIWNLQWITQRLRNLLKNDRIDCKIPTGKKSGITSERDYVISHSTNIVSNNGSI